MPFFWACLLDTPSTALPNAEGDLCYSSLQARAAAMRSSQCTVFSYHTSRRTCMWHYTPRMLHICITVRSMPASCGVRCGQRHSIAAAAVWQATPSTEHCCGKSEATERLVAVAGAGRSCCPTERARRGPAGHRRAPPGRTGAAQPALACSPWGCASRAWRWSTRRHFRSTARWPRRTTPSPTVRRLRLCPRSTACPPADPRAPRRSQRATPTAAVARPPGARAGRRLTRAAGGSTSFIACNNELPRGGLKPFLKDFHC